MTIGIAILAAGASSRMGQAKQLLPWNGSTLLRSVVTQAHGSGIGPVAVVLGAHAERIAEHLALEEEVTLLTNPDFAHGQGTSIHAAVHWGITTDVTSLILLLADQPFITSVDLLRLSHHTPDGVQATRYPEGLGVPACFGRDWFSRLLAVEPTGGAKHLLREIPGAQAIDLPHALLDLDTPNDYANAQAIADARGVNASASC